MAADQSIFGNKVRLRVCGILISGDEILLAQIHSPISDSLIWIPPGGGVKFGEPMVDCLRREFKEETNISVQVGSLLHVNEVLKKPFHAVECYFEVQQTSGDAKLGKDPELSWDRQLLHDLQWMPISKLPDIDFVPSSLLPKIQRWEDRSNFSVFVGE